MSSRGVLPSFSTPVVNDNIGFDFNPGEFPENSGSRGSATGVKYQSQYIRYVEYQRNWLMIDGKSSIDFDMYISGGGTYASPEKIFEEVKVPGRNGSIFLYEGAYENVDVSYDAWIAKVDDPDTVYKNFRNLKSYLMSRESYIRLEDTYHPDEIRFGTYNQGIEPDVHETLQAVQFKLNFTCKPQRFLKRFYDQPVIYTNSGANFRNETYFDAKPLIRVFGAGTFTINGVTVTINTSNSYIDFDCDLQEAYRDTLAVNCNNDVTLINAQFPYLKTGDNFITFNGPSSIVMYPRLYTL